MPTRKGFQPSLPYQVPPDTAGFGCSAGRRILASKDSQRGLEDDGLRYAGIVSTDRGLMLFKECSSFGTPKPDDVVPLTTATKPWPRLRAPRKKIAP
ncbi:hypothetical protein AYJ54_39510 [Bradyrhizobium centrolobii]|uniref:Uncharacterized protein n=1 Tax=Bradyrhizobium centrolobii TaxID=1505087 RepID=A0A176Z6V6_9BRAD|nr:hypothetical protein [Bradyrhizobium centrolobii]OAF15466.1 hypothetical protein AYJ54_39510 [Bradyrhizobium centrolobii]